MSILGSTRHSIEVCATFSTVGATEVIDVECRIAGNAGGKANIRASLHIRTAAFDDEKWKIITLAWCCIFRPVSSSSWPGGAWVLQQ